MSQSQADICPHPAERPSQLLPIPPLKVVTEHWVELPVWLTTSDFFLVTSSWFLFQPFLLTFATERAPVLTLEGTKQTENPTPPPASRVTHSVEHNLSSLSC